MTPRREAPGPTRSKILFKGGITGRDAGGI